MKRILFLLYVSPIVIALGQNTASYKEYEKSFLTYGYSSPDPVPNKGAIYPYFRYDVYEKNGLPKNWKIVELENSYISLIIMPEIGGKIWSAREKKTGKSFLYDNRVVKFRDVAMRGPWTSGGIEPNYGIIGHTPNCATAVDYKVSKNEDGSVSCFIGTLDLLTQTNWMIEVSLHPDNAYFTTRSFWFNSTPLEQPYYTWMNTGIKAAGNLEFVYPGNRYLGHEGEYADWPINQSMKRNISFYDQNNFGTYKSYHVFGRYTDFFGAYWHNENFGMGHFSNHDQKPGKKIWIWGLSRQGMIWDKILTDNDGQYVEVQSGRLFNQSSDGSSFTPFKHVGFKPSVSDGWIEYWFPVSGTNGLVRASNVGSLNVKEKDTHTIFYFQPIQPFNDTIKVLSGAKTLYAKSLKLEPLQVFRDSIASTPSDYIVRAGKGLVYSNRPDDTLTRPVQSPADFNWTSTFGLYTAGMEAMRSRYYDGAENKFTECLKTDPNYLPALNEMASLHYRKGDYKKSLQFALHGLSIDTYDAQSNYFYGLSNKRLNRITDALDGFDLATFSIEYRSAAYFEIAKIYFQKRDHERAIEYSKRSIEFNVNNLNAHQLLAVVNRITGKISEALEQLKTISKINPLNQFIQYEAWTISRSNSDKEVFSNSVKHELPHESFIQLADWYIEIGLWQDAYQILSASPQQTEVAYWMAYCKFKQGDTASAAKLLNDANAKTADLVFPFRLTAVDVFDWAMSNSTSWKPRYYSAIIKRSLKLNKDALNLLEACGSAPDFAPFFSIKAELKPDENDLLKAAALEPNNWHFEKRLFDFYIESGQNEKALSVAEKCFQKKPNNSVATLIKAKALLLNSKFKDCSDLLLKSTILPAEGATDGRTLFSQANLFEAISQIKNGKYKLAISLIEKSMLWPENLGSGKPYENDIDLRLVNYLMGYALKKAGSIKLANEKFEAVINSPIKNYNTNTLIQAITLRKLNKNEDALNLLNTWSKTCPEGTTAKASVEFFNNGVDKFETNEANRLLKEILALK